MTCHCTCVSAVIIVPACPLVCCTPCVCLGGCPRLCTWAESAGHEAPSAPRPLDTTSVHDIGAGITVAESWRTPHRLWLHRRHASRLPDRQTALGGWLAERLLLADSLPSSAQTQCSPSSRRSRPQPRASQAQLSLCPAQLNPVQPQPQASQAQARPAQRPDESRPAQPGPAQSSPPQSSPVQLTPAHPSPLQPSPRQHSQNQHNPDQPIPAQHQASQASLARLRTYDLRLLARPAQPRPAQASPGLAEARMCTGRRREQHLRIRCPIRTRRLARERSGPPPAGQNVHGTQARATFYNRMSNLPTPARAGARWTTSSRPECARDAGESNIL